MVFLPPHPPPHPLTPTPQAPPSPHFFVFAILTCLFLPKAINARRHIYHDVEVDDEGNPRTTPGQTAAKIAAVLRPGFAVDSNHAIIDKVRNCECVRLA